ncbi:hypothetical protein PV08_02223 [Exophiala spinifera]|uniref:Transcription factor domain-containing protein n=1 Tax=Exophiala spinifera TaxID=91928 RepID=A0A0D2BRE8_9EURO|nr:uncharacterized protein PV08_02223 [Exophiala spinifera]KIW21643.1 hypothetical protein PV08_02223 [Exophiala spinifera]
MSENEVRLFLRAQQGSEGNPGKACYDLLKPNRPPNVVCRRVELLRGTQDFAQAHTLDDEDLQEAGSSQREPPTFRTSSSVSLSSPDAEESITNLLYTGSADTQGNQSDASHRPGDTVILDLGNDSLNHVAVTIDRAPAWGQPTPDCFLSSDVPAMVPQQSLDHVERLNSYTVAATAIGSHTSPQSPLGIETSLHSPQSTVTSSKWPLQYDEKDILQWLEVFFERLHATLPIVDKGLYRDFMLRRHHTDKDFAAMILGLCSLAVVGPVYRKERNSMAARTCLAKDMLASAANLRTSYDFGEQQNLETTTVTSFFMRAAWLRLREAVECGRLLGVHKPETYKQYSPIERGQRLRIFLILSVTERGYALQRNHDISFTGQTSERMADIYQDVQKIEHKSAGGITIHDDSVLSTMLGLQQLMKLFDSVDEQVIPCWNNSCSPSLSNCDRLTVDRVQRVFKAIEAALHSPAEDRVLRNNLRPVSSKANNPKSDSQPPFLTDVQWGDCYVLQQWLLMRLWTACLTHDALSESSSLTFMQPSYATVIADRVLDECNRVGDFVLEVHGNGMIERLHDLAMGVLMSLQFYAATSTQISTQNSQMVLDRYLELLCRLGGDEHPCTTALRRAYESAH